MSTNEILYAFAQGPDGTVVHIDECANVGPFACIGCGATLVAKGLRDGAKVQPHFSHIAASDRASCSPETLLHRLCKTLVVDAHARARRNGAPYPLTWRCACSDKRSIDCAAHFSEVMQETRVVQGVTSDLAFVGSTKIAVEIVVTHPLEPNTLLQYKRAGVQVFEYLATWENVITLLYGIEAAPRYTHDEECPRCADSKKRDETRVSCDPLHELDRFERSLWNRSLGSQEAAEQILGEWPDADRHGSLMHEAHRNATRHQAMQLLRIGFKPLADRPWTFRWVLDGIGAAEVDLGREKWEGVWLNGLARRLNVEHGFPRVGRVTETLKKIVRHHLSEHDVCLDDVVAWQKRVAAFLISSGR